MTAFIGLLKKDWILGRKNLAFAGILQLLVVFIAYLFSEYFNEPWLLLISGILIIIFHIANYSLQLLLFLNMEGKTQLWLYNPNSSWVLLGAKLTISLIFNTVSVFIACCIAYIDLHFLPELFDYSAIKNRPGIGDLLLMGASVTVVGIFLGVFVMFLWVIYHSLKQVRFIKSFRGFTVFLLAVVLGAAWDLVISTTFMTKLGEIAVLKFGIVSAFELSATNGMEFKAVHNEVSLLMACLQILVIGVLFWLSAWLLDRKVEV
ncbi:hypothetical protein [Bacillus sp. CECT 9360]|uniref:hypothetical protein n=1 Tax=Bacillus sp. CECT 9360 TaxID=2845821 RepID=UPI001E52F3D8|nr:hypothetical protein [Bacillus sp. CECT 9360]CAH0346545.1 hypothetical protein BCI9360_02884 [Bacillus sp. CECT 9360]